MGHSPKQSVWDEIISGINVDTEETEQSEPGDSFKTSNSHMQVPQKDSCPEPASSNPLKPQLDAKAEDGRSSVPLIPEELPTNKSRLSPLAARAALASFVSAHGDGTSGTELDDLHESKTPPTMDSTSSEDPSTLDPVSRVANDVKKLSLDEKPGPLNSQLEESTAPKGTRARSKRSTISPGLAKPGRVTRSSVQKGTSSLMDAEAIPRSTLTQIKNSSMSTRNKPKKSTATQKQEQESSEIEDGMGNLAQEAGYQRTTVPIKAQQIEGKRTGQSAKRKLDEVQTPARVTRSAVRKSSGNADTDVQVKSSNKGASKKRTRSTPSTGLEKTDEFAGSQKKKEPLAPQMDLEEQTPPTKKVKANTSSSTKKAQQTEGTSTGRKGKSHEQKTESTTGKRVKKSASKTSRRFSPRLHHLPRTRSQVKSSKP